MNLEPNVSSGRCRIEPAHCIDVAGVLHCLRNGKFIALCTTAYSDILGIKKMRHTIKLLAVAVVFLLVVSAGAAAAQTTTKPEETARQFYAWYLSELGKDANPIADDRGMSRFVTIRYRAAIKRALDREEGIGADVFIDAQDWDPLWAKNISATRFAINGTRSTVNVTLKGGTGFGTKRLKLILRKESSVWKIDSVNGAANP
jgi:hypothetical protein